MILRKINNKIVHNFAIILFSISFFSIGNVNAATLQINSNTTSLSPGGIMTLSVNLNSEGVAINNAEAKIVFPSDLLEIISVSKSSSIFSLWVEEPAYSNITGIITFNGGVPTPGFTGSQGSVLSIVVKAKSAGQADFVFADAAVRANDGLGTDVLTGKTGKKITIANKNSSISDNFSTPSTSTQLSIQTQTQTSTVSVPTLQITSATHPSQDFWYKDNSPHYKWKIPTGVDAVQTIIGKNSSSLPRVTYSPAITEKLVQDLGDGVWYFKIRGRKSGKLGPVSTYIVQVDRTSPKNREVTFSYDDTKKILDIKADIIDETSGLDYFDIYINDILIKKLPASEFVNGNYQIFVDNPGDNTVKLVAVDHAGNSKESLGSFKAKAVEEQVQAQTQAVASPSQPIVQQPEMLKSTNKTFLVTIGSFTIPVVYFIAIIISTILILVVAAFRVGLNYGKSSDKFVLHKSSAKGDNINILLLLRRNLEERLEMLQQTRHNRILSNEEKNLRESIEVDLDEIDRAIEEGGTK